MTEAEWNTCTDPRPMLDFVEAIANKRKLKLFVVACYRRMLAPNDLNGYALGLVEQLAEGRREEEIQEDIDHWQRLLLEGGSAVEYAVSELLRDGAGEGGLIRLPLIAAELTVQEMLRGQDSIAEECGCQAIYLRCVFGNPFRPVTLKPSWLTPTANRLADAIYEERAFDRLRILADALEDAGCTNADILNHCRQPGEHVRGCWVIDLLTGRQ